MKISEKTHTKVRVICLRHGIESVMLLDDDQLEGRKEILCPKTSLPAIPMTLGRLAFAVPELIKEIAALRQDIFDLQCAEEERAEPGVSTG